VLKKIYFTLLTVGIIAVSLYSQPQQSTMYCRGGLFQSAYLAMTNIGLPNGTGKDYTWISPAAPATSSGNYNFSFNVSNTSSNAGKYWGDNNATIAVNTPITFLVSSADAHWVIVSGKKYVATLKDVASGTNSVGYMFEFGGTPATINSAANTTPAENLPVTVTANMSGSLVTNQTVYVRWSTSSTYATSTVTQMTGSGSTYTASIPGQPGGTTVYYYCFSSGVTGLTSANCNPATINAVAGSSYSVAVTTPSLTVTPTALTGFTYVQGNGPSTSQSYSISGVLLTGFPGNITVSASTDYEVSTDNLTFSGSTVSVPFTAATLNPTPVYVRLKAGLSAANYNSELIANAGGGIPAVSVTCSGLVTLTPLPALTVQPASLTGFAYTAGSGPSVIKSFSLSGSYLTGFPGNITVQASKDFEVSTDSSTFSGVSVNVPYTSAVLNPTNVYLRLKAGLAAGAYNAENIAISGGAATAVNVTCSGAVSAPASQVIKWTPSIFTDADAVTITFDATQGDAGLKGYTGDVYAHTGVLTNLSVSSADWKYVKTTWGTNTDDTKMTRIGTDLYQLVIGPSVRAYYGVAAAEQILKLCFVFRSSTSTVTGRDLGGADLFVTVSASGLNVLVTSPTTFPIIKNLNEIQEITIASANSTNLALYANNVLLTQTAATAIDYNYTCSSYGKVWFKAVASNGTTTKVDSFYLVVRPAPTVQALPAGIVDGINYLSNNTSVVLSLYAPLKQYSYVIGDFNNWQIDPASYMNVTPDGNRYWVQIDNLTPGTEYGFQYLVDGNLNVGDPYCDKILDQVFDTAISAATYPNLKPYPTGLTTQMVSVLQTAQVPYVWKTTGYKRPPKDNLIIYELFIRDFVSTHSFKTLIDTIGYFKNLGVNAIELMPISEFDMNDSWGYNPDFMLAPDKYYGPKNDVKAFVDICHQNGIAVIFDLVLNQQTGNSPMARLWWDVANNQPAANNPYFNTVAPHPYSVYNDLNHTSPATQYFVDRVVKNWLTEYKFDGYRFDLSKGFTQTVSTDDASFNAYDQSRVDNLKRIADVIRTVDSSAYIILEHFADNSEEIVLTNYNMMTWDKLSASFGSAAQGLSPMDVSWGDYKVRSFTAPSAVDYMESHDEERLMYLILQLGNSSGNYNTKTLTTALDRVKLSATFLLLQPGPKMLWQFGELGYDVSIMFNGKAGDKPLHWEYYSDPDRQKLFRTFKYLDMLKTTYPVFRSTNYTASLTGTTKRITIIDTSMSVNVIGNFDVTNQNIVGNFPNTGIWYDYFSHTSINVTNTNMNIYLMPGEYHVYTTVQLPAPDMVTGIKGSDENKIPTAFALEQNYPNPFNPSTIISYNVPMSSLVTIKVYNILGSEVATLVHDNKVAGTYKVTFDASHLSSGVYFYRLDAGNFTQTKKLVLLK
jgi:1,4-alpha-glucan branching enzyme